ncbi:MAG: hypothetical protein ACREOQ_01235 [Gemmatimonadales bacterium]
MPRPSRPPDRLTRARTTRELRARLSARLGPRFARRRLSAVVHCIEHMPIDGQQRQPGDRETWLAYFVDEHFPRLAQRERRESGRRNA